MWVNRRDANRFHCMPTQLMAETRAKACSPSWRAVFPSIVDLQAAINRFIDEHNQTSRPFVWRADPDAITATRNRRFHVLKSILWVFSEPARCRRILIFCDRDEQRFTEDRARPHSIAALLRILIMSNTAGKIKDIGPQPQSFDIERATKEKCSLPFSRLERALSASNADVDSRGWRHRP